MPNKKSKSKKQALKKQANKKPAGKKQLSVKPAAGKPKKKKPVKPEALKKPYKEQEELTEQKPVVKDLRTEPIKIVDEMRSSYIDYAMSVIVARALPDVRDGLKPVHRRILYAMWDIGLKPSAKFRKSATVVGEVLGKYHPHGDVAVYDSMVRMAQDFSMRHPLVNGQGNFGSMDGDSAAAMRYTEAKLASIAETMLSDIEKDTVNFIPNYDGSQKEPSVLPARLPQLLLNGTMGIAVGMATNIPPHNLNEICEAASHLIDNPDATVEDLMKHVQGPDFPTGGQIFDIKEIKQAYATGKGGIVMRGKTEIVEKKNGLFQILITEVPYQVNKATLLERIAELVRTKKIEGIKDLRDESSSKGVRVVIELKKESYPKKILNQLYKHTALQDTFHVNMLALVDGIQPRVLTLKMVLEEYIKHQKEVVTRRAQYELAKAEERAHILQGLKKALDNINAVIATIKKSKDREQAKINLMKKFKFTERQAIAILEMKLQQLANLEQKRIEDELKEKLNLIKDLKALLASPKKILGVIKDQLKEIMEKYGEERRTRVFKNPVDKFTQEDLVPNEPAIIMITKDGYIKRLPPDTFKTQERGGKGVIGLTTKEEDMVERFFTTMTHTNILFFTTLGKVFQLKGYEIPPSTRTAKGQAMVNFLQLAPEEKVSAILPLDEVEIYKYLVMVTKGGVIKKTDIGDFAVVRRSGLIAIKLKPGDRLEWVDFSTGKDNIVLSTQAGQAIRFEEKNVRPMGRTASGVRGIRLKGDDIIVGMDVVDSISKVDDLELLVVMKNGYGKRSPLKEYKIQGRGGSGIKTANITEKTGKMAYSWVINKKTAKDWDLVIISQKGQVIRLPLRSVSTIGRATQGVRLMRFKESGDKVASVTAIESVK